MSSKLVSVIIPAFNAQDFISETIESVLHQSYKELEVIVVDDGSTDKTADIVKKYGSNVYYIYQNNSGGCAVPRNTGIDHCSGDYLCFIDSDDIMISDNIAKQVDFFESHDEVGLVFSDYINFKIDQQFPKTHFEMCPCFYKVINDNRDLVLENACIHLVLENFGISGSFMVRRNLLNNSNWFDSTLKSCEDFHFYYRIARQTKVGIINEVGMMRRLHDSNMSNNSKRMLTERIRSRTLLYNTEYDEECKKLLRKYIASCWFGLSRISSNDGKNFQSIEEGLWALRTYFDFYNLLLFFKNITRSFVLTIGLYKNNDS